MLERIIQVAQTCSYDFRSTACPDDPLKGLFDHWVPYYATKWAIARILRPATILEVGVRFGYSALAFLDACPEARYLGIDLDVDRFGGCQGAIRWARQITHGYAAAFVIADSQQLTRFFGGHYDLIHIDGQQDEKGLTHDLTLALGQGKYVLVDGYFWTRQNFLALSEFLHRHRDLIEFYGVIPGYAGELVIKPKPERLGASRFRSSSSLGVRGAYTRDYYLLDCGGYDSFQRSFGGSLADPRLHCVTHIARVARVGRALDLGCGRGEISLSLAREGFEVTAIDYSEDAIELAKRVVRGGGSPSLSVTFSCCDVNSAPLKGLYDVVIASDLVEHLAAEELERLYRSVARHLAPDGLFVVHTYPNLWYYRYDYGRRLRLARLAGAYLPTQPRTRYELLMHINEQSPRLLRRQLKGCFEHVLVWFGSPETPVENLERRFSKHEMRAAPDLFAVASHSPVPRDRIVAAFRMEPLPLLRRGDIVIQVTMRPQPVRARSRLAVTVVLRNGTARDLRSMPPHPVHLSYHWLHAHSGESIVFDGERTRLHPMLRRDGSEEYEMMIVAPPKSGTYVLRTTLVQEGVRWLDRPPECTYQDAQVCVV